MGAQPVWVSETRRVTSNVKHVLDTKGQALEQTSGWPLQRHMGVTAESAERVMKVCGFVADGDNPFFLTQRRLALDAQAAPTLTLESMTDVGEGSHKGTVKVV